MFHLVLKVGALQKGICLEDAGTRGKALYKVANVRQRVRRWQAHVKTMAMGELAAGQPDTLPVTRLSPI
jgi:hypothetical protein